MSESVHNEDKRPRSPATEREPHGARAATPAEATTETEQSGLGDASTSAHDSCSSSAGAPYPPADFTTFVLSLSTSALMHLGVHPDPTAMADAPGASAANRAMAEHTIELLAMLERKTRGNLSGEEERLLTQLLRELREQLAALRR